MKFPEIRKEMMRKISDKNAIIKENAVQKDKTKIIEKPKEESKEESKEEETKPKETPATRELKDRMNVAATEQVYTNANIERALLLCDHKWQGD